MTCSNSHELSKMHIDKRSKKINAFSFYLINKWVTNRWHTLRKNAIESIAFLYKIMYTIDSIDTIDTFSWVI